MIVGETEDSPSKSLAEMKVAAVSDLVSGDDVDVVICMSELGVKSVCCLVSTKEVWL